MIGRRHLFLGFTTWDARTGRIADKRDHHTYTERSVLNEHLFRSFLSWAQDAPQKAVC